MPRSSTEFSVLHRYLIAIVIASTTLVVRMLMAPLWETTAPFALFMMATVVAAWFAGSGPAWLVGAAGVATRAYFDYPHVRGLQTITWEEAVRLTLFAGFVYGIGVLLDRMKEDRQLLEVSIQSARMEIEERRRVEATLVAARAEAEEANRLKDEFLAMVSHELRTPLNAILGWSSLLRTGTLTPSRNAHAIDVIQRNARAQAQLVGDLLDVARSLTGRLHLEHSSVNLIEIAEESLESIRPAAEKKRLTLVIEADTPTLAVWGDPARLQQLTGNLLSNAVKFTPQGGRIVLALHRRGNYAELTVSDTGAGIPAEFLPRVFDRFSQAEIGTTRSHGGLGLGLAIVRHIAELHGGSVAADSEGPGKGARFTVLLPLHRTVGAPDDAAPQDEIESADPGLSDLTFLVVDDEQDSRVMAGLALESAGARVLSAASADEALRVAANTSFDAWIIDIAMPGEDGLTLLRRLRALPRASSVIVPALALTAFSEPRHRTSAVQAGFQRVLTKPVTASALISEVSAMVAARHPFTESSGPALSGC